MVSDILVNIDSGNGLLPDSTKPLYVYIYNMVFTLLPVHGDMLSRLLHTKIISS